MWNSGAMLNAELVSASLAAAIDGPFSNSKNLESDPAFEAEVDELTGRLGQFDWKTDKLDSLHQLLISSDAVTIDGGLSKLKRILCTSRAEVFKVAEDVISADLVPRLVQLIGSEWPTPTRQTAAFCLTNISAGTDNQTKTVVTAGAIEPLLSLLNSREESLKRQAVFCLANIAGTSSEYRNILASCPGYFAAAVAASRSTNDPRVGELVAWNLRNVCILGGPDFDLIRPAIEFFASEVVGRAMEGRMSVHTSSPAIRFATETLSAACLVEEGRELITSCGAINALIQLAEFPSMSAIRGHALECLFRLADRGTDVIRQKILVGNGVRCLCHILSMDERYSTTERSDAARTMAVMVHRSSVGSPIVATMVEAPLGGISAFDVAFRIVGRVVEDVCVRESAGRLICSIVAKLSDNFIAQSTSINLLQIIFDTIELGTRSGTDDPPTLILGLAALDKLVAVGAEAERTVGDNPVRQILLHGNFDGPARLESAIVRSPLENLAVAESAMKLSRRILYGREE